VAYHENVWNAGYHHPLLQQLWSLKFSEKLIPLMIANALENKLLLVRMDKCPRLDEVDDSNCGIWSVLAAMAVRGSQS